MVGSMLRLKDTLRFAPGDRVAWRDQLDRITRVGVVVDGTARPYGDDTYKIRLGEPGEFNVYAEIPDSRLFRVSASERARAHVRRPPRKRTLSEQFDMLDIGGI